MSYSEKAIERLIDKVTDTDSCFTCAMADCCMLEQFESIEMCKAEIKRVLAEWSEEK